MTPKEKANDLLSKMWMSSSTIEDARECALIAVDEILNDDWYIQSFDDMMERKKYWEQVKNEIELL